MGALLLIISIVQIFSFRLNLSSEESAWRLTRVAMIHSHLMASEHMQNEIGMIDPDVLETLESMGYHVSFLLYDPERDEVVAGEDWIDVHIGRFGIEDITMDVNYKDGMGMPRNSIGYNRADIPEVSLDIARYSLPVVYGGNKYGVLIVFLSSTDPEEWSDDYWEIYENLQEIYEDEFEMM
jgi:hypothetical protein